MGHELYRMIRDGAPSSWSPLMRLVAETIADDARDPSQGMPEDGGLPWSALPVVGCWRRGDWFDSLTERCGMSERAISRTLSDLAEAGYELREQIGTDKRGKPVFAHKGTALRFRVPRLAPRERLQSPPDLATSPQSPPDLTQRPANSATPSPQVSSPSPQSDGFCRAVAEVEGSPVLASQGHSTPMAGRPANGKPAPRRKPSKPQGRRCTNGFLVGQVDGVASCCPEHDFI